MWLENSGVWGINKSGTGGTGLIGRRMKKREKGV